MARKLATRGKIFNVPGNSKRLADYVGLACKLSLMRDLGVYLSLSVKAALDKSGENAARSGTLRLVVGIVRRGGVSSDHAPKASSGLRFVHRPLFLLKRTDQRAVPLAHMLLPGGMWGLIFIPVAVFFLILLLILVFVVQRIALHTASPVGGRWH